MAVALNISTPEECLEEWGEFMTPAMICAHDNADNQDRGACSVSYILEGVCREIVKTEFIDRNI